MSSIARLRAAASPAQQTPERAALAAAIANRDAAATRLTELRNAQERLPYSWKAEEARDAAAAAIEEARRFDVRQLTDATIGNTAPPPPTLPAARAAHVAAEDALAAAIATRDTITADIAELTNGEHGRGWAVDRAIQAVLLAEGAPAVAVLVRELEALHRNMVDRHLALRALARAEAVVMKEGGLYTDAGSVSLHFRSVPEYWAIANHPGPISAAWEAAIAALKVDATAALPGA